MNAGGRVAAYRDMQGNPLGPARVWHLHEDIPGLAMSRSFGDQAAAEVGVNAIPEITEMNLVESDKFMILASDGVWEFSKYAAAMMACRSSRARRVRGTEKLLVPLSRF